MGFFKRLVGMSAEKEQLLRRLLRARVARDPSARAMGQGPEFADSVNSLVLMGLPEGTIVACVESWAQLKKQGLSEPAIAQRIAAVRGGSPSGDSVADVIRDCVLREHGHSGFLPADHVDWCIEQARASYGV
ncbi:MAG: hypothetical protein KDA05_01385 [Phycisphaerales bacterium]|nr:hypothetical protein [Phycisphaerales bacterium]